MRSEQWELFLHPLLLMQTLTTHIGRYALIAQNNVINLRRGPRVQVEKVSPSNYAGIIDDAKPMSACLEGRCGSIREELINLYRGRGGRVKDVISPSVDGANDAKATETLSGECWGIQEDLRQLMPWP